MYEDFYGLSKRPFSVVPNADSFVGLEPAQEALDALLNCVVQGRGIAVVTSPAGLGKTLLCKRLADVSAAQFQSVYLSASAFGTRRALLQAVLYEFGIEYEGVTEQEARFKIMEAARAIAAEGRFLLLIVDEAHLLISRLFEELRVLTDYAPAGEALIRLVLSGQFELEEKLADPALTAVNQRIGCQVCLEPLTLEQSAELLQKRLHWAGAKDVHQILTTPAVEAICRASDGNPRCLCQLADHSFLLGYSEEQRPIDRATVVAALDDLKELPLHWNDLSPEDRESESQSVGEEVAASGEFETDEFEVPADFRAEVEIDQPVLHVETTAIADPDQTRFFDVNQDDAGKDATVEYAVLEVGADIEPVTPPGQRMVAEPDRRPEEEERTVLEQRILSMPQGTRSDMVDQPVVDKYAELDRQLELPVERRSGHTKTSAQPVNPHSPPLDLVAEDLNLGNEGGAEQASMAYSEEDLLGIVEDLRREIGYALNDSQQEMSARQMDHDFGEWLRLDVVQPEPEVEALVHEDVQNVEQLTTREECLSDSQQAQSAGEQSPSVDAPAEPESEDVPQRFAQLFTRLRRRRQRLQEQSNSY